MKLQQSHKIDRIKTNREERSRLINFKNTYFTIDRIIEDLDKVGPIVRLQFLKILYDFTLPKPLYRPEEQQDFEGIEFEASKQISDRKIFTFEKVLSETISSNGKNGTNG